jgi:hypothetical protein
MAMTTAPPARAIAVDSVLCAEVTAAALPESRTNVDSAPPAPDCAEAVPVSEVSAGATIAADVASTKRPDGR